MANPLNLLDELNKSFSSFFNALNISNSKIIFDSANFNDKSFVNFDNLIVVLPEYTSNIRRSIGVNYSAATQLLYVLRLHTNNRRGNIEHQRKVLMLQDFFSKVNPNSGYKRGDTIVVGPELMQDNMNWIVSNVSSIFETREDVSLDQA